MSEIGKAGGRGSPPLSNDQSVSSSGNASSSGKVSSSGNRSARIEDHPATQSSPAQAPAEKTGIGEKIAKRPTPAWDKASVSPRNQASPVWEDSELPDAPQIRSTSSTPQPSQTPTTGGPRIGTRAAPPPSSTPQPRMPQTSAMDTPRTTPQPSSSTATRAPAPRILEILPDEAGTASSPQLTRSTAATSTQSITPSGHTQKDLKTVHAPSSSNSQGVSNRAPLVADMVVEAFRKVASKLSPQVVMSTVNLLKVSGDTKPASEADLKTVYDAIKSEADAIIQSTTFLRATSPHSKVIHDSLKPYIQAWVQDLRDTLASLRPVAFTKDSYDPELSKFSSPVREKSAQTSVSLLKDAWEQLFGGGDKVSTKSAALRLPQAVKDLIATGFKAIDESTASDKQMLKDTFASDIVLRGVGPQLLGSGDIGRSMMELGKIFQSISNGKNPSDSGKEALSDKVGRLLGDSHVAMRRNMHAMFLEASMLGTPYHTGAHTKGSVPETPPD